MWWSLRVCWGNRRNKTASNIIMKVIMAGMTKTGTKSMCEALTVLGYDVYDWMENFWYLGDDWIKQIRDGVKVEDLKRMYQNVDAVTDNPCNIYWEELAEAFPEAKIILTTRDEDQWYKSLVRQFDSLDSPAFRAMAMFTYTGYRMHKYEMYSVAFLGYRRVWPFWKQILYNEEALRRMYRKHNLYVQQKAPKDRLLVIHMKDLSWKPLCDFLNVPIPDVPFPHKNKGANILDEMRTTKIAVIRLNREFKGFLACCSLLLGYGLYRLTPHIPFCKIKSFLWSAASSTKLA